MRVLIADDQVWLRSALRLLLEHETDVEVVGEVGSANSLQSTIARVHPDLLFLDWQLPGLDTNGARQRMTQRLHVMHPELFIIALTDDDRTQSCLTLGADALVNRAEPPDRIVTTLRQAAAKLCHMNSRPSAGQPLS
jgi:DNA-binding NarL/FixJ family response regulator